MQAVLSFHALILVGISWYLFLALFNLPSPSLHASVLFMGWQNNSNLFTMCDFKKY